MQLAKRKILVAFFSHSGNTHSIASQINKIVGGDLFEILSLEPYPRDYNTVVAKAKQELKSDYKPALKTKIGNIHDYDVIYLGYPNWWGTMPMAVFTFLETYSFSGKTIIPFCTHEGSGIGKSEKDIQRICAESNVLKGIALRGSSVSKADGDIKNWLKNHNLI